MTIGTFLGNLLVGSAVMAVWGFAKRTSDAKRYRHAPPDLSGFGETIRG
jgi:hypothetical protein